MSKCEKKGAIIKYFNQFAILVKIFKKHSHSSFMKHEMKTAKPYSDSQSYGFFKFLYKKIPFHLRMNTITNDIKNSIAIQLYFLLYLFLTQILIIKNVG